VYTPASARGLASRAITRETWAEAKQNDNKKGPA
jgi:hypothetical protein